MKVQYNNGSASAGCVVFTLDGQVIIESQTTTTPIVITVKTTTDIQNTTSRTSPVSNFCL